MSSSVAGWLKPYIQHARDKKDTFILNGFFPTLESVSDSGDNINTVTIKATGGRIRPWTGGTPNFHDIEYAFFCPVPSDGSMNGVCQFTPSACGTDQRIVHQGALFSVMDNLFGTCSSRNDAGGATLNLVMIFHNQLPFNKESGKASCRVVCQMDGVMPRKAYLTGSVFDENGTLIATAKGLWRTLAQMKISEMSESMLMGLYMKRMQRIVKLRPSPSFRIDDSIIKRSRSENIFQRTPWVDRFVAEGRWEEDTHKLSKRTPSLHFVRKGGKIRSAYFWDRENTTFVVFHQFSEWCQGPPGMCHGGSILSAHVDACEAAMLCRGNELVGSSHTRYVQASSSIGGEGCSGGGVLGRLTVDVNYRGFSPLGKTYRFEVKANTPASLETTSPASTSSSPSSHSVISPSRSSPAASLSCVSYSQQGVEGKEKLHSDATIAFSLPDDLLLPSRI